MAIPRLLATVLVAVPLLAAVGACTRSPPPPSPAVDATLGVEQILPGSGDPAAAGAWVRVHYTGWLQDPTRPEGKGRQFDSSVDHGQPFLFQLGTQSVIRGWDLGVTGMRPGGRRRLVIPSALAYGEAGAGGVIPPGATLIFDVELLDFRRPPH